MASLKKSLQSSASVKRAGRVVKHNQSGQPVALTHPLELKLYSFLSQGASSHSKLLLALSGGLDSCVLLHLLVKVKHALSYELHAMHVHHGLSENADAWAVFCQTQCQHLNIPLQLVHVNVSRSSKQGVEAAARELRYQSLHDYRMNGAIPDFVITAHHQDDQAETLLLQLFRGAGAKGLASMAAIDKTRRLLRPLLEISRHTLLDYAIQQHITWCDDESNDDTQYERNYVRHKVMPVLESRYQSIKSVLARTASHLAEANQLLNTLATLDAETLISNNHLCLQGLAELEPVRAKNVLRWWFSQNRLSMPTSEHLAEVMHQLLNAKSDTDLNVKLQHAILRRYQQKAYLCMARDAENSNEAFDMLWSGESLLNLPNGGKLQFRQAHGTGLALRFGIHKLRITNRRGGERFKPNPLRPTRTLKYLLQEANVPPWQRNQIPLVYWQDTLAYVPKIGIAHELAVDGDELGLEIIWIGSEIE